MDKEKLEDGFWQEEAIQYIEIHYFTPTPLEKSNAIWPVRLGRNEAKLNYHVGPRITPYYSLHFVLDGSGYFVQDNQAYRLNKGDLFCLFPQLTQEYYTSVEQPLRLAWIAFDGKLSLEILDRIGLHPNYSHLSGAFGPDMEQQLEAFFELSRKRPGAEADLAKSSIFFNIMGRLAEAGEPRRKDSDSLSWLQKGIDYMKIHFAEGITVEEVARYVGINRTHFGKSFRKKFEVTPVQYLQRLKIEAAKFLLKETEHKLTEIAQSVGYPDLFTFSKAFKKQVGMPPNHFRHKI